MQDNSCGGLKSTKILKTCILHVTVVRNINTPKATLGLTEGSLRPPTQRFCWILHRFYVYICCRCTFKMVERSWQWKRRQQTPLFYFLILDFLGSLCLIRMSLSMLAIYEEIDLHRWYLCSCKLYIWSANWKKSFAVILYCLCRYMYCFLYWNMNISKVRGTTDLLRKPT